MKKPWRLAAIVLFMLVFGLGGVFGDRLLAVTDDTRARLKLYTELMRVAHERYGGEVAYRDLVYASIDGMLRSLDPHTNFLPPEAYSNMQERQQASFYGLGILVGMRNSLLTVITPIEGTPASRLGIRAGDVISTIEGEPTKGMSLDQAVRKLKGPKDTQVRITIARRGLDEPLELTVTRAEIPQTTVRYAYMLDPQTGYMMISDFGRGTSKEVADAVATLREQGMQRLVLDLRNNGGGLLDQAVETADQFVPKGLAIVETRGRTRDSVQEFSAAGDHSDLGLPLVVLVNGGTASAAEILSGAIQDHDIGLVAGTPTWGKGLVQTVYTLPYGAGIALTTAKYYTPSGRLIQRDYSSFYDYYAHDDAELGEDGSLPLPSGPAYTTDLGRTVYGGGGITPDVAVEPEDVPAVVQFLLARNSYLDFGVDYQRLHPQLSRDWQANDEVLAEFRSWLEREREKAAAEAASEPNGEVREEPLDEAFTDPAAREYSRRRITAEVMNAAYGQQAWHQAMSRGDRQIQEATKLFDRAAEMLAERREAEKDPDRLAKKASEVPPPAPKG
jgi:carboxyl-terminal processing protease